ncbi:EI24 domain-containing protein [Kordiimonas sp. SCSIO 12603]|uniref:EI24 domain-containing protein n=1 Tax=Kordiimonas sp. SCSIO 12603 TaxID=2829596 RepID=UPI002106A751|nr:EI24 domain-containing protein [Kordiimonas sp. SCSIO 12603]UTW58971.1 EI24 domain-containing protein [Kordiimonas sp. SCSIO 12603]
MIGTAINRTWQQLLHPKFRSVFLTSVASALITLIGLTFVLSYYWPETFVFGWDWIDELGESIAAAGFWAVVSVGSYLLFPGIVTMVMGVLIDKIATAVEEEYYPNRIGTREVPITDVVISAGKLTLIMLVVNLLALVPYIILFFMTASAGAFALFIAINGFLLGREYYEMVAMRHMDRKMMNRFRMEYGSKIFMVGAMMAAMFAVPFLNILAPIIGAAVMTHVFHHLIAQRRAA